MKTLLVISALAASTISAAPVELAVSSQGEGLVTLAGVKGNATIANVVLKKDGKFSIGLVGDQDMRIAGQWSVAEGDRVSLRIEEAAGKDAKGTGSVNLHLRRDGQFEVQSLDAAAMTDRGVALRMNFRVSRPALQLAPVPVRAPAIIRSTRGGRGVFRVANDRGTALTHAHVELLTTGRAFVNVYGDIALGYIGTWKNAGPETKTLEIEGGIAGENITGAVRLDHDNKTFTRIELSGTFRKKYYSIEFDAPRR